MARRTLLGLCGWVVAFCGIARAQEMDDAYLWLEDVTGEKPLAWAKEQNAESVGELAASKGFATLKERLRGLRLETMSVIDDRVNLHYQHRRQTSFDWTAFTNDLKQLAGPAKLEVFIG